MNKRILLLSAYDALSHEHWRQTLAAMFPEFSWTQLSLPARHFSWRIRGNSLSWGFGNSKAISGDYDLLIATSMVDLASLRGMVPALATLPTVVYFHENQFEYPMQDPDVLKPLKHQEETHMQAQLTSIYSALCAQRIVFNSQFNRTTFLNGARLLLKKMPDCVPPGIVERLKSSITMPVPIADTIFELGSSQAKAAVGQNTSGDTQASPLKVAWNHRWEYDKGPQLLLQIIKLVIAHELQIQFFIFGQQFRQQPSAFNEIAMLLANDSVKRPALFHHLGYIENTTTYLNMLAQCDVALSTAQHDFQGLALMEGCALGCSPLAPDNLVYPEYLEPDFLYGTGTDGSGIGSSSNGSSSIESSSKNCAMQATAKLKKLAQLKSQGETLPTVDVSAFSATALKKSYLALFNEIW